MSPLTVTSVASAAIISGDLIIGLSDGSIINCGRVQGPQGLDGPAGPIGAPGLPGRDGNTILTSEGFPRPDVGTNGDYIIDKVSWTIYGPKASGVWARHALRGNSKASTQKRDLSGRPNHGRGNNGGGRIYNTSNLALTGLGRSRTERKVDAPGGNIIPEGNDLKFQSNLNRWIVNSFVALDEALPVSVGDVLPDTGEYEGDLFLKDGVLYIYTKSEWIAVGGGDSGPPVYVGEDEPPGTAQTGELWYCTDEKYLTLFIYTGTTWAAAAPPVSLDGIESSIFDLSKEISEVNNRVTSVNLELEQEVAYKAGDRANNLFQGQNVFDYPVRCPGTQGNEAITYEQLANLAGEIDEIKAEKEKGEWIAKSPAPAATVVVTLSMTALSFLAVVSRPLTLAKAAALTARVLFTSSVTWAMTLRRRKWLSSSRSYTTSATKTQTASKTSTASIVRGQQTRV